MPNLFRYEIPTLEQQEPATMRLPGLSRLSNLASLKPPSLLPTSPEEESLQQLQKEIANYETRIQATGEPVPPEEKRTNLLVKAMDIIDRPRNAVANAIKDVIDYENGFLQGFIEGLTGKERAYGADILDQAGIENPWTRGILGFAMDVMLDPLTYVGGVGVVSGPGTKLVRKGSSELASRLIGRNVGAIVAKEGSEGLLRHQAEVISSIKNPQARKAFTAIIDKLGPIVNTRFVSPGRVSSPEQARALEQFVAGVERMPGRARGEGIVGAEEIRRQFSALEKELGLTGKQAAEVAEQAAKLIETPTYLATTAGKEELEPALRAALGTNYEARYQPLLAEELTKRLSKVVGKKGKGKSLDELMAAAVEKLEPAKLDELIGKTQTTAMRKLAATTEIYEPIAAEAPEAVRRFAELARTMFERTAAKDIAAGVKFEKIPNYVRHLYDDPPEKVDAVLREYRREVLRRMKLNPKAGFQKERLIPTIEEAERRGLHPIKDVRLLAMVREMEGARMRTLQQMWKGLKDFEGSAVMSARDYSKAFKEAVGRGDTDLVRGLEGWVQLPAKEAKGMMIHPDVAKAIERAMGATESMAAMGELFGWWNQIQNIWKGWVTSPNPAFHLRNLFGNVYNSVVLGDTNPVHYLTALYVLSNEAPSRAAAKLAGAAAKEGRIILGGREWTAQELLDEFRRQGLFGFGFFRGEGLRGNISTAKEILMGGTTPRTVLPSSVKAIGRAAASKGPYRIPKAIAKAPKGLVEGGMVVGDFTETWSKMAHFLDKLNKGFTPEQAAEDVRKYLFDYSQLTQAERGVRSVVPFFTFTRKNMALQFQKLITNPGKLAEVTHLIDNMREASGVDDMPEWLRDQLGIPLPGQTSKGYRTYAIFDFPTNQLAVFGPEFAEWTASMLSPFITTPVELAAGRTITGREIEPYKGARSARWPELLSAKGEYAVSKVGGAAREVLDYITAAQGAEFTGGVGGVVRGVGDILTRSSAPEPEARGIVPPSVRQLPFAGSFIYQVNPKREAILQALRRRGQLADYRRYLEEVRGVEVPTVRELQR